MLKSIYRFLQEEDGPTAIEYCVMLMLIVLVCITVIQVIGQSTGNSFQGSADKINQAKGG